MRVVFSFEWCVYVVIAALVKRLKRAATSDTIPTAVKLGRSCARASHTSASAEMSTLNPKGLGFKFLHLVCSEERKVSVCVG